MSQKILITGGCGYIGSHTIVELIESGYEIVCVDDNSNSSPSTVEGIAKITNKKVVNHQIDLKDRLSLRRLFEKEKGIDGIIHFAAYKKVGESVDKPLEYYENNISGMINLIMVAQHFGVKSFIFSSSCSVYGNTEFLPVKEDTGFEEAESPYGRTKQIGEYLIKDVAKSSINEMKFVILRYFNPAGAHASGMIGEDIDEATSLVPMIVKKAMNKEEITIFGKDYSTKDGTCVRDYIHVTDLAKAHCKAVEFSDKMSGSIEVFNVGTGSGVSVKEMVDAFNGNDNISETLLFKYSDRRPGDIEAIYANTEKAVKLLNWETEKSVTDVMESTLNWYKSSKKK